MKEESLHHSRDASELEGLYEEVQRLNASIAGNFPDKYSGSGLIELSLRADDLLSEHQSFEVRTREMAEIKGKFESFIDSLPEE